MPRLPHVAAACLALGALASPSWTAPAWAVPFGQLVVFGDSNVDDGNYYAASGGTAPVSPPYYQGRFSDGPVVVEYAAQRLGIPLVDYAYGGARTGADAPADGFTVPSALTQIASYTASLNGAPIAPDALVVLWAGSNDLLGAERDTPAGRADLSGRIAGAVGNVETAVTGLVQQGARTVLVANRTPRAVLTSDNNLNGIDLNAAIAPAVQGLAATLGADIRLFDAYGLIADMQTDPAEYGFTNTTDPCLVGTVVCADPAAYTQWDAAHKTTRVHSLLADALIAQAQGGRVQDVPEPASLALVGAGLLVLAVRRRAPPVRA